jgi:hypothetical protein
MRSMYEMDIHTTTGQPEQFARSQIMLSFFAIAFGAYVLRTLPTTVVFTAIQAQAKPL